jgi:hypothetical protein
MASMEPEVLVRRAALVALPLLLLVGYLLRSGGPDEDDPETRPLPSVAPSQVGSSSLPESIFAAPSSSPSSSPGSIADERSERDVRESPPPPPPVEAARLPEIEIEQAPVAPVAPSPPGSPCGGLFVRLITMADDPKFAFASMAVGYDESAEILHVGESIAGYRVTGIEWDRVWVQGAAGRCAVGMHLGAREAAADLAGDASAEAYASLPWVLPHEITSGMV